MLLRFSSGSISPRPIIVCIDNNLLLAAVALVVICTKQGRPPFPRRPPYKWTHFPNTGLGWLVGEDQFHLFGIFRLRRGVADDKVHKKCARAIDSKQVPAATRPVVCSSPDSERCKCFCPLASTSSLRCGWRKSGSTSLHKNCKPACRTVVGSWGPIQFTCQPAASIQGKIITTIFFERTEQLYFCLNDDDWEDLFGKCGQQRRREPGTVCPVAKLCGFGWAK